MACCSTRCASDLVKVDAQGQAVQMGSTAAPAQRVNRAGFVIHSAVHQARPACIA
jgi:ribulose-5-phosphate 4-epimerase/fuculose-1-phosphate aldolase